MAEVEEGVMGCTSQPLFPNEPSAMLPRGKTDRVSRVVLTSWLYVPRCAFSLRGKGKCPSVCYRASHIVTVSWLSVCFFFF